MEFNLKYKLLNSYEDCFYLQGQDLNDDGYYNGTGEIETKLISFIKNTSNPNKQFGYSKTEECNWAFLILVSDVYGDGEFNGHSINSTYLKKIKDKVSDHNNNEDIYGEYSSYIRRAYHPFPDGKVLEIEITNYENDLNTIFEMISTFRQKYILEKEFKIPSKSKTLKM